MRYRKSTVFPPSNAWSYAVITGSVLAPDYKQQEDPLSHTAVVIDSFKAGSTVRDNDAIVRVMVMISTHTDGVMKVLQDLEAGLWACTVRPAAPALLAPQWMLWVRQVVTVTP